MGAERTLGDDLAQRSIVTRKQFDESRSLPLQYGTSWAVWGSDVGDMSVFDDVESVVPRLRRDVVLIGVNPGAQKDQRAPQAFQNFHLTSNDAKLRNAVVGTDLEGALLTDLVKDFATAHASELLAEVRAGRIRLDEKVTEGFRAEQEALGLNEDTLYVPVGKAARLLWDELVRKGAIPESQKVFHKLYGGGPKLEREPIAVENLPHYSGAVDLRKAVSTLLAQPALGA